MILYHPGGYEGKRREMKRREMKRRIAKLLCLVLVAASCVTASFSEEINLDEIQEESIAEEQRDFTEEIPDTNGSIDSETDLSNEYTGHVSDSNDTTDYQVTAEYAQTIARQHADHVNAFRTSNTWQYRSDGTVESVTGRSALTYDYGLEQIAMQRAAEIAFLFEHQRPNGEDPFDLFAEMYPLVDDNNVKSENIAMNSGYADSEAVALSGFIEEDKNYAGQGHRRNMLNASVQYIGVGHCVINGTHYWVQEFSSAPYSATYTAPLDGSRTVTVTALDSLMRNGETTPTGSATPVDTNTGTVTATYGNYKVVISMNKAVPFCKKKADVLRNLNVRFLVQTTDGKTTGITLKKTTSTKPKKGSAKVTFKLKGSTKEEKKAVKKLNKQLKKILITVRSDNTTKN